MSDTPSPLRARSRSAALVVDPAAVRLHRRGEGKPLVLLHCLGVDHRLWDIAAGGLADAAMLVSFDFPGHGETALPDQGYSVEDLSALLAAVLDRAGIARADVAGISLGGLVAQHFAATRPERVDRLMLIDTTPRYTDEMRGMWGVRAAQARREGVISLVEGLLPVWFTPGFIAEAPAAVAYVRACFAADSGEGYALACEALAAADLRALLPPIAAPTLIVCGEEDVPPFREAARDFAAAIPDARIEWLARARHASVLEQPDAFAVAARRFLAGAERA
jgi:3-oxoadipate enol-lactonase